PQALDEAQRAAHTLKGSANTVGIRGIATLAHQLEDMLGLLARESADADPTALTLLEEGADSLAEMSEAVAGQGQAPQGALEMAQRIADWVSTRLARDDEAAASAPTGSAEAGGTPVGATATEVGLIAPSEPPEPPALADPSEPPELEPPAAIAPVAPVTEASTAQPAPRHAVPEPSETVLPASLPDEALAVVAESPGQGAAAAAVAPSFDWAAGRIPPSAVPAQAPAFTPAPGSAQTPVLPPVPVRAPSDIPDPSAAPEPDEPLRVSARVLDRMLDLAAEASILLAQAQEQLAQLQETRVTFRVGSERLQDLANELERVVDLRSITLDRGPQSPQFDALELDEYDDLHTVSRRIAESGADSRLLDRQLDRQAAALGDAISQLERVQGDLRETVMQSRMVPVATIVPRLQRATRQAARMAQRRVQLDIHGDSTAVDAQLLQSLIDPLTHLLRNAVDHGIEDETERLNAGKPAAGRIELSFEHTGRELQIRCHDDGRGLDEPAVLARAIERGLVDGDAQPTPAQVSRLVLAPGFSTRDAATQLSGRGIGLDVVNRAVVRLRGQLDIRSEPTRGMSVDIALPIALAGLPVLVARTPTHVLALSIRQVEHIVPGAGVVRGDDGEEQFAMEQGLVPVRRLDVLLGLPRGWFQDSAQPTTVGAVPTPRDEVALLVRTADGGLTAVIAPELSHTRRVVVRPLPVWLPAIAGVEGACVLGDGSAAPVIDLPQLLSGALTIRAEAPAHLPAQRAPVCLVVDDSVSVRRSMEAFLRDVGFEVDAAGDGLEALARLAQRVPDLAIVDLEMPRMNGVELSSAMRQDLRTCEVPIIMITSRASEKHRRLAVDAGVDVFMTKPYTEDELAAQIRRCLERKASLG
ncbi:MAG TPA: response regulator, partial [Burkholderiaceae bacterium]|nr:response regulator [Burkholderiaceae bacterium]